MSNYLGRKSDFIPSVYTRYFERTDTQKSSNGHIYFDDHEEDLSKNYQVKRDLLFKRLFPAKYADQNNNTNNEQTTQNGSNPVSNNTSHSLGDYISLSNETSSTRKKRSSSPQADSTLSSSEENDNDDLLIDDQTPSIPHASIVGHVHPRSVIENVRAVLIREFYQRTSDAHTEWLKCKMNLPRNYINPKYYADFQRRYRKEIQKQSKSFTNKSKQDTIDLTKSNNDNFENDDMIKPLMPSHSDESSSPPEFIVLQSDDDNEHEKDDKSTYFIDRSSRSFTTISQPESTSNDDYHEEDSKYSQLPTRNQTSSSTIIRPIISKHQRRKKTSSNKPLVSAIDRIIDHMDQSDTIDRTQTMEEQNLLIKQIKKRKKKKKKNKLNSTNNEIDLTQ